MILGPFGRDVKAWGRFVFVFFFAGCFSQSDPTTSGCGAGRIFEKVSLYLEAHNLPLFGVPSCMARVGYLQK